MQRWKSCSHSGLSLSCSSQVLQSSHLKECEQKDRVGSLLLYLSLNSPWHTACVGAAWASSVPDHLGGGKWQLLVQVARPLSTLGVFLVQNTSKEVSCIARRGFMVSDGCHKRHTCLLPPLSRCRVLLHGVACRQHCVRQAKAGPDRTMWTLWLLNH